MKKLFIVGGARAYAKPFRELFDATLATKLDKDCVALFTGGGDVDPELYGEANIASDVEYGRDSEEQSYFKHAKDNDIPMIGICRGAQFLTVMNGGKLYQDVSNHAIFGEHTITTSDLAEYGITSTHHQMMRPRGNYELLAWTRHLSDHYLTDAGKIIPELDVDPEIVFYPDTKSLCIQGHPEYMAYDAPVCVYIRKLVKEKLLHGQ